LTLFVGCLERFGNLSRDRQRLIERQRPAGDLVSECLTFNQLHHQRAHSPSLFTAMDLRDVWVVERGDADQGEDFVRSEPRATAESQEEPPLRRREYTIRSCFSNERSVPPSNVLGAAVYWSPSASMQATTLFQLERRRCRAESAGPTTAFT
jgi:hypothetical protein